MYEELLRENLIVQVRVEEMYRGTYPSRIEEVGATSLILAAPSVYGAPVPVRRGEMVEVTFVHLGGCYSFATRVLSRRRDPIPVIEVEKPREIKKIQRRNYVRVDVVLPMEYRLVLLGENNSIVPLEEEFLNASTVNISGGGILFTTAREEKVDDLLQIRLHLTAKHGLNLLGRVVRLQTVEREGLVSHQVAVKFERIRETQRDVICRFVLEKERELIKKGLVLKKEDRRR